jgi:hypothetical protein
MGEDIFKQKRKSYIEIGEVFFWAATINQWQKLLWEDNYKDVILSSLEYLTNEGKIASSTSVNFNFHRRSVRRPCVVGLWHAALRSKEK